MKINKNIFRPAVAAMATGLSARCLDEAARYSLERKAFGTHIANFQVRNEQRIQFTKVVLITVSQNLKIRFRQYHSCLPIWR